MGAKQKAPNPEVSRSNTLQRMLDAEKVGKINRIQTAEAASSITRSSIYTIPTPDPQPPRRPTIQNTGRAMSTPSLSLNIPLPKVRYVLKDGNVIPEDHADAGAESETSSICQSPGWDDLMGSKRKKEKKEAKMRKKEKEKAEAKALAKAKTEAKHAEKLRNRLSKATAPPTTRKLSKVRAPRDRSSSVPTAPKSGLVDGSLEEVNINEEGARRGSIEVGLKSFIQATHAIPVPWRSSHGTPANPSPDRTSPSQEQPNLPPATRNDSFIGGLKLKQVEGASVQQEPWRQSQDGSKSVTKQERKFELGLEELDNHTRPKRESEGAREQLDNDRASERTPQQWESIYEQAARMMMVPASSQKGSEQSTPREKIPRTNRGRTYPPTSYFSVAVDGYWPRRDSSAGSNPRTDSRPGSAEDKDSSGGRTPSEYVSKRPFSKTRRDSVESGKSAERGRRDFRSYVGRHRKQSQDQSVSGLEDEYRGEVAANENSETSAGGRRSSWTSIKSFGRNSSTEAPSTIRATKSSNVDAKTERQSYHAALLEGYTPSSPQSDECESPEKTSSHQQTRSKGSLTNLRGFKTTARAAFTRNPSAVKASSVDLVNTPTEEFIEEQLQPRKRPSNIFVGTNGRNSKAERFFGQPVSASSNEDASEFRPRSSDQFSSFSFQATPRAMERQDTSQSQWRSRDSGRNNVQQYSHSRSTTASSEEYSTFDESSNVTTPMASTHKAYFPGSRENVNNVSQTAQIQREQGSQSVVSDTLSSVVSGQKVAQNTRIADAQSRMASVTHSDQPSPEIAVSLSRHPSLSRSVSTPELQQDLSFLPALKHQPLTKPAKAKDTNRGNGKAPSLAETQGPTNGKPNSMIKPATLSPPTKNPETTAPVSPISSQYLKNARMALPRPPRSGAPAPAPGGPDPIAKMFVVCCSCKYFHDMPSKIYECMARSESVVEDKELGVSGLVSTSVRCPWCNHGMTTACCAGYAAVVVLREKLH